MFRNLKGHVSRSVGSTFKDLEEISGRVTDRKIDMDSSPVKTYRNCMILSAVVFALLLLEIFQKDAVGIAIHSALFACSIGMSVAMYVHIARNGTGDAQKKRKQRKRSKKESAAGRYR